jgi:hypothetical protein
MSEHDLKFAILIIYLFDEKGCAGWIFCSSLGCDGAAQGLTVLRGMAFGPEVTNNKIWMNFKSR